VNKKGNIRKRKRITYKLDFMQRIKKPTHPWPSKWIRWR